MARKKAPTRHRGPAVSRAALELLAELKGGRERAEANAENARRSATIAAVSGSAKLEATEP